MRRSQPGELLRGARRTPVALAAGGATTAMMVASALDPRLHETFVHRLGLSWADLTGLRLWRLVTNLLVPPTPGLEVTAAANVVALGAAERLLGSAPALVIGVGGDWLATLPILLVLRASGSETGRRFSEQHDGGMSAVGCATAGAVAMNLRRTDLRRPAVAAVLLALALPAVRYRRVVDLQHLAAGVVGAVLGARAAR